MKFCRRFGQRHSAGAGFRPHDPGFEDALVGAKAGEERVITPTFPEDYQNLDLAGKTAEFTVTVNSVAAPQLPELNEEFFAQFGVQEGGVEGFRAEVKRTWSANCVRPSRPR